MLFHLSCRSFTVATQGSYRFSSSAKTFLLPQLSLQRATLLLIYEPLIDLAVLDNLDCWHRQIIDITKLCLLQRRQVLDVKFDKADILEVLGLRKPAFTAMVLLNIVAKDTKEFWNRLNVPWLSIAHPGNVLVTGEQLYLSNSDNTSERYLHHFAKYYSAARSPFLVVSHSHGLLRVLILVSNDCILRGA